MGYTTNGCANDASRIPNGDANNSSGHLGIAGMFLNKAIFEYLPTILSQPGFCLGRIQSIHRDTVHPANFTMEVDQVPSAKKSWANMVFIGPASLYIYIYSSKVVVPNIAIQQKIRQHLQQYLKKGWICHQKCHQSA